MVEIYRKPFKKLSNINFNIKFENPVYLEKNSTHSFTLIFWLGGPGALQYEKVSCNRILYIYYWGMFSLETTLWMFFLSSPNLIYSVAYL